jgi:hypothetical protein
MQWAPVATAGDRRWRGDEDRPGRSARARSGRSGRHMWQPGSEAAAVRPTTAGRRDSFGLWKNQLARTGTVAPPASEATPPALAPVVVRADRARPTVTPSAGKIATEALGRRVTALRGKTIDEDRRARDHHHQPPRQIHLSRTEICPNKRSHPWPPVFKGGNMHTRRTAAHTRARTKRLEK